MKKVKRFHDTLFDIYDVNDVKVLKVDIINKNYVVVFKLDNKYYYLRDVDYVNSVLSKYLQIDYVVNFLLLNRYNKVVLYS